MKALWSKNPWVLLHFLLLFVLVIIRAFLVPLVSDEAFTYFLYVEPETVFYPAAQVDANNHYLNSLLSIWSMKLLGANIFAFRLPNVLSFVIFYFSAFKISEFSKSKWQFYVTLFGFTSIYPVLEFFSLSRGYGISFAFLLLAIYQVLAFYADKKFWRAWFILILLFLILFAQLSLLFACAALFFLVFVQLILTHSRSKKLMTLSFGIIGILMFVLFTLHIKNLQDGGLLYFGVSERFPVYNIISLNDLLFQSSEMWLYYVTLGIFVLTVLGFLLALVIFRKELSVKKAFVFPFLLFSSVTGILIAVFFMHGSGPLARTALYLYLLLIGSLFSLGLLEKRIGHFTSFLILLASIFSMTQINMNQVNYWENQRVDNALFTQLKTTYKDGRLVASSIYIDRNIEMTLNHFMGLGKSVPIIESNISEYDLVLLTPGDVERFADNLKNFELIYDGQGGVSLFENRRETQSFWVMDELNTTVEYSDAEFVNMFSFVYEGQNPTKFLLSGTLSCQKKSKTASWNLVVQFFDDAGAYLHARYYPINRFSRNWNLGKSINFYLPIAEIPALTKEMRIYLYNPLKLEFEALNINATLKGAFPNP
jgi:hypothetical protein